MGYLKWVHGPLGVLRRYCGGPRPDVMCNRLCKA
uniref:Uncharacterized protein n=1 Tax=Anguilla anguilla TaxID=7936 RepID=A0A0E9PUZ8_ANGAN